MMLKIEKVNSKEYRLLEDITVSSCGYEITVYKGFIFDGASIPKLFRGLIGSPFTGKYTVAALVHDALYASEALERQEADEIFLDLMKEYGVGYLKRYTMYWAVRAGGRFVWNKHKPEDVNIARMYIDVKEINC